jgi:hypothetical protein
MTHHMRRAPDWTLVEKQWLQEHYYDASWDEMLARFPRRTRAAINTKARLMGLHRSQPGCRPPKYPPEVVAAARDLAPIRVAYLQARRELDRRLRHYSKDEVRYIVNRYASQP